MRGAGLAIVLLVVATGCRSDATVAVDPPPVDAFRYHLVVEAEGTSERMTIEQVGEVVLPDRESARQTLAVGELERATERLQVGQRTWIRGDLPWLELGASPLRGRSDTSLRAVLDDAPAVEEDIDGVATTRHDLDVEALAAAAGAVTSDPQGLALSIWLASDSQLPVRMAITGSDGDATVLRVSLDVETVDGDSIDITEPTSLSSWLPTADAQIRLVQADGDVCRVGDVTIPCDDDGILEAHPPNCDVTHYHGELDGAPDPVPDGCGHGEVTVGSDDTSSSGLWDTVYTWIDVIAQGVSGGFSPKSVQEAVDDVANAAPSIKHNIDRADEYFEVYEDAPDRQRYTLETEDVESKTWAYRLFWSWFE